MFRTFSIVFALVCLLCCSTTSRAQVAEAFKAQAGKMIGTWIVEETKGEVVTKGELTAKWSEGGETVIWNYKQIDVSEGTPVTGSGMLGWDGKRKKVVEVGFWSTGEAIVGVHDQGENNWNCQTRITVQLDDAVKNGQAHRQFNWKTPDELEVVATKVFIDHRPKPDYTTVFRRKKEADAQ